MSRFDLDLLPIRIPGESCFRVRSGELTISRRAIALRQIVRTIAARPIMRNVPTIVTGLSMRHAPLIGWRLLLNGLGLRKGQKVFAVGFAKCATTSLHALFVSLGLPSFHGIGWRSCNSIQLLRTFDCFSDGIPKDLEKLDRLFPGSKFVLQVRDLQSWVYSRLGHIERNKKRGKLSRSPRLGHDRLRSPILDLDAQSSPPVRSGVFRRPAA